jgi:CHAT domain-containing protein
MSHAELLSEDPVETSLRQATNDFDRAAAIYTGSIDFANAATALLKSGDIYFALSEYAEAIARYKNAQLNAGKINNWADEARALSRIARVHSYLGRNDLAQKRLNEAAVLFKQHEDNHHNIVVNAYVEVLSIRAEVAYARGDFIRATKYLENALQVVENDHKGEAKVRLLMGYIAGSLGETEKALTEITTAAGLYRATNDKTGSALALTALGLSHSRKGADSQAIELHLEALKFFRSSGDRRSHALTLNALGQAYQNLKEYSIALNTYKQAFRIFQEIGVVEGMAVTSYQIATAYYLDHHPDEALEYFERCLKLSKTAGNVRTKANALTEIAKIYGDQGRRELAIKQYRVVLRFYDSIGDLRGQAEAAKAYGDFLIRLGKIGSAADSYSRALSLGERISDNGIVISSLYHLAQTKLALGSPEAALPFIQRSLNLIEESRASVLSPEFRVSYFSGLQMHYELCREILMELDRRHPLAGFAIQAFLASEKSRARLLLELVSEPHDNIRDAATRELLEHQRKLQALFRAQAEYEMDLSLRKPHPSERAEADSEFTQLRAQYQEVQAQLKRRALRIEPPTVDLLRIQNELNENTTLLEYALGSKRSYLWAVTSTSFQSYELPARKILEQAAHEFYNLVTARQEIKSNNQTDIEVSDARLTEKSRRLSQMLLGPVYEQLGQKQLLVVADGALQYIPFDALLVPTASTGSENDSASFLIERNQITIEPSITTLIAIRDTNHKRSPKKLVAILADPVLSSSDERIYHQSLSSTLTAPEKTTTGSESLTRDARLARLEHATEEADAISSLAPRGTTLVAKGFDANRETAMSSEVSQYQILHFATHGFLDIQHPELSGIVLSAVDQHGMRTNGLMSLQEIYGLHLSAELTVLSACQTALGKDTEGEGLIGLAHSFMSAGSKSVVASLWKIDDRATAVLMADFYEQMLQKGLSPAAALKSAKLKMVRDKRWNAPYYWAGFVLQGEYSNRIVIETPSGHRISLAVFLSIVLLWASLLVFQKGMKRKISMRRWPDTSYSHQKASKTF